MIFRRISLIWIWIFEIDIRLRIDKKYLCTFHWYGASEEDDIDTATAPMCAGLVRAAVLGLVFG